MTRIDPSRGAPRRVLITGIANRLASRLALRLEADDRVEYVGGLDLSQPSLELSRTEFVRADLRNPLVARVIESARVDTIVHCALASGPASAGGRSRMKELNVIGTMQLLAAAQKAPRVRRVVVRSTTAVYGSSPNDPALFREDAHAQTPPRHGYGADVVDIESSARAFGRRRPDVDLSILRFAPLLGPDIDTALSRYFELPVMPTVLGHDPRLQVCHTDDAEEILFRAAMESHPGITNVGAPGIVYLSQAARMMGRPTIPVPMPLTGPLHALGRVDTTADQLPLLAFGRIADISRMRRVFGMDPKFSTRAALEDFIASGRVTPVVSRRAVQGVERRIGDLVAGALRRVAS